MHILFIRGFEYINNTVLHNLLVKGDVIATDACGAWYPQPHPEPAAYPRAHLCFLEAKYITHGVFCTGKEAVFDTLGLWFRSVCVFLMNVWTAVGTQLIT